MIELSGKHRAFSLKKCLTALLLTVILFVTIPEPLYTVSAEAASASSWAIIIGTNLGGNASRLKGCKNVVVDVQYYYPNEIKRLKAGGRKIYSYMSIGSL